MFTKNLFSALNYNVESRTKNTCRVVGLVLASIFIFASCMPPAGNPAPAPENPDPKPEVKIEYLQAKDGISSEFIGTWNGSYSGEVYTVTENKISDAFGMELNVVDKTPVVTTEGWTLVFCQIPEGKGTAWTPAGNLYAAAFMADGEKLKFISQLDWESDYKTLDAIKAAYTTDYQIGINSFSICTKEVPNKEPIITLTDSTGYMTQVKFEKSKITLNMMKNTGFEEYTSFVPTRDKSKESENVLLYLYDADQRNYVADLHYAKIEKSDDGNTIYWYEYDDDEEGNDATIDFCNESMPVVSASDLEKIISLYE